MHINNMHIPGLIGNYSLVHIFFKIVTSKIVLVIQFLKVKHVPEFVNNSSVHILS